MTDSNFATFLGHLVLNLAREEMVSKVDVLYHHHLPSPTMTIGARRVSADGA